jgi:hypothetical protein
MSELAILPTYKPFRGANPKTPIARGNESSNVATREMLTRWRFPWDAPNAIEANQTKFRAEPEIAVGCLSNFVDGAFEKTVADRPRVVRILIDVEGWV